MRSAAFLLILLALAACGDRRSFDDRYDETANEIEQRAARLDAELNKAESDNQAQTAANRQ